MSGQWLTEMRAGAQRDIVAGGVEVYLWVASRDGAISVPQEPLVFGPQDGGAVVPPVFFLGEKEAVRLMDDLWNAGIRPSLARAADATLAADEARRFLERVNEATPGAGRDG